MSYTYQRHSSVLANYEELEKAAEFEWILPTSKIKELIGISPKTTKDSDTFIRGSFAFIKQGKIGNETGWKVAKQVSSLDLKWLNPVRLST
ncbi:hypothetical protein FD723_18640 [Nostoc sp. C052]|nr:hypothetical protein FD723_18640 [Nostoc sp. C052]